MWQISYVIFLLVLLAIALYLAADLIGYLFFGKPSLVVFLMHFAQLSEEEMEEVLNHLQQSRMDRNRK